MVKSAYNNTPHDNYIDHQTLLEKAMCGADIYVTQLTDGNYYEYIPISNHAIIDGHVHLSSKYPSASSIYHSSHYMLYHYYNDLNSLGLIRTTRVAGDGYNGGMFGLPTCTIAHNWSFLKQRWVIDDCWTPSKNINIHDVIHLPIPIKIRITMDSGLVVITRPSVMMMNNDVFKTTSIRTEPFGIVYQDHVDINEYELHLPYINCRTWVVTPPPKLKMSIPFILMKFNNVVRRRYWDVKNFKICSGFHYDILVRKQNILNKRMMYELPSGLNKS